ncbi:arginase family protein [Candidatus Woesearchaeota archaeon]|nr:arginase family protein [Candidatus Woesearchaeota archaeon]
MDDTKRDIFLRIPFDGSNLKVKGSREAPNVISNLINMDVSDVIVDQYDPDATHENIYEKSLALHDENRRVIGLGGDHSVTFSLVKAASEKYRDLTLVYFDAHIDAEDDFLPPTHEDVIKSLVKVGAVKPKNILIVGARNYWEKELEFVNEEKIKVLYATDEKEKIANEIYEFTKNKEHIYLSLDVDFFDSSVIKATGYPESGGFELDDFKMFMCFKEQIVDFDIVEFMPSLDEEGKELQLIEEVINYLTS